MPFVTKLASVIAVAAVVAPLALSTAPLNAAGGDAVIKERIDLMRKDVLDNWKPIKAYAKSGKGTPADVSRHAKALGSAAKKIPVLFPKGTGRGDYPDKVTRALPEIWKDWKGFEKATQGLVDQSAKLAKIADGGDKDAIVKQIGITGKIGCGGCHKPFRGAKVKK